MKKIFLIASIGCLVMTSCKKDRTCTCTTTNTTSTLNGVSQTLNAPKTTVDKLTKVSKKEANCNSGETTNNYTYSFTSGGITYNGTVVEVNKVECKLS